MPEKPCLTTRTCRRCSVTRVNILCELYDQAFGQGRSEARRRLEQLTRLAVERGYEKAGELTAPGLNPEAVRSLSWNVSSLLNDDDLERLGLNRGRKK
ncbi:MAG: hypothetical protein AB1641_06005 [Thermodesulfobacteriota bacterium]